MSHPFLFCPTNASLDSVPHLGKSYLTMNRDLNNRTSTPLVWQECELPIHGLHSNKLKWEQILYTIHRSYWYMDFIVIDIVLLVIIIVIVSSSPSTFSIPFTPRMSPRPPGWEIPAPHISLGPFSWDRRDSRLVVRCLSSSSRWALREKEEAQRRSSFKFARSSSREEPASKGFLEPQDSSWRYPWNISRSLSVRRWVLYRWVATSSYKTVYLRDRN